MRVLHICDQYHKGGLGNLVLDLHRRSTHQHEAFGFAGVGAMKSDFENDGLVCWDEWPSADEKFDLWVSHTAGAWGSEGIIAVGKKRGIPVVEHMVSNGPTPTDHKILDGFIAPNESVSLVRHMDIKNSVCLYDPIDLSRLPGRSSPTWIGKSGRVVPEKAPDVFADIAELFQNREFLLIGGGNMEQSLRNRGIKNLSITGMVSQESSVEMLSSVYLYVYPTRDDSYGRTVAQAMCMGIPVIYQSNSPVSETAHGLGTGCRDLTEFVSAVDSYLADSESMDRLAVHAREFARHTYGDQAFQEWDNYIGRFC